MYEKQESALNNKKWLICNKTKLNQTEPDSMFKQCFYYELSETI